MSPIRILCSRKSHVFFFLITTFIFVQALLFSRDNNYEARKEESGENGLPIREDFRLKVLGADSSRSIGTTEHKFATNQACKLRQLELYTPEIAKFFHSFPSLECEKSNGKDWGKFKGRIFVLKHPEKKAITCYVRYLERVTDHKYSLSSWNEVANEFLPNSDFFEVYCSTGFVFYLGERWSGKFMRVARKKDTVANLKPRKPSERWTGLNVLMLGFDSLSHMTVNRKLPKTLRVIENELKSVVLNGYNIVGDGTPQAFIPILTGQTEEELPNTRKRYSDAHFVNVYPWIWNNFSEQGFATVHGEDVYGIGTYNYRLKGFDEQPTDHYPQTFFHWYEDQWGNTKHCLGQQPLHMAWLEYAKSFWTEYDDLPKFAVMHHASLSHDDINAIEVVDEDLSSFLQEMYREGFLNNTLLFLMADHGNRFAELRNTEQGQLEERLPFFSVYLPAWFRTHAKYQDGYNNLLQNKDRLTTPFDIYDTMVDVLKWPTSKDLELEQKGRGVSLFRKIPKNRTCQQAGIQPHFCACLDWKDVSEQNPEGEKVVRGIINAFNQETEVERKLCAPLRLESIEYIRVLETKSEVLNYKGVLDADGFKAEIGKNRKSSRLLYQTKFRTQPGNAVYEATVEVNLATHELTVDLGAVSHVNAYGNLPDCIKEKNPYLMLYCVCNVNIQ